MRIFDTPEMAELWKICEPYSVEIHQGKTENVPEEAINAYKKYYEIRNKLEREEIASWFD